MDGLLGEYFGDNSAKHTVDVVHQLAQHTHDAFLITKAEPFRGPAGPEVVYINPAFTQMTGYEPSEIIGKTPHILQTKNTNQKELNRVRRALETWSSVRTVLLNAHKTGEEFWVELDIVPIANSKGWFTHWASIQRNVTERVENERRLAEALDAAEEASLVKTRFLSTVSHELRTPLNAVIGFAEILELELLGPHQVPQYKRYSSDIRSSGQQLLDLVEDILTVAEAPTKASRVGLTNVALSQVVAEITPIIRQHAREAGVQLDLLIDPMTPDVKTNRRASRQIMLNLITNAIKASPPHKTVKIIVDRGSQKAAGCFSVTDQGDGIPDTILRRLNEEFKQSGNAYVSKEVGFGLGLSIVDRLCMATGAELGFSRPPAGGTVASVSFPTG